MIYVLDDTSWHMAAIASLAANVLMFTLISLTHYAIAYADLQSGALQRIPDFSATHGRGYRLLINPNKAGQAKIGHFRTWLEAEIAQMKKSLD